MPLNKETDSILKDLERAGFDLTTVRQQAQVNPLLENAANAQLGGRLLRREEFTRFKEEKEREVTNLRQQVRDLAANQDALKHFEGNDELYKQALEVIELQRQNLVEAGFDPEEVKNLSLKQEQGLRAATSKATTIENQPAKEEPKMPDKDYVDNETFQTVAANIAGGAVISGVKVQRQLMRAQQLGIEVTDELADKFEKSLLSGLQAGKTYEQIANESFGFDAAIEARRVKETQATIDSEVRKQVAEKLKEAGVSERQVSTSRNKSLASQLHLRSQATLGENKVVEGSGGTADLNGRKVPVNKFGEVEHYRLRGSKAERMNHATEYLGELEDKRPELFEDVY